MSFLGFVTLEATLKGSAITRSSTHVPTNGDSLPTYRIYGPNGLMTSGTGTTSFRNTGSITGTDTSSPILITSASHGLTTGTRVTITGVVGQTGANGTFVITNVSANTFTLDGSTSVGAWVSGGTWNVSGLYLVSHSILAASGYEAGTTYSILVSFAISSTSGGEVYTFIAA